MAGPGSRVARRAATALILLIAIPGRGSPARAATLSLPLDAGAPPGSSTVVPLYVDDSAGMLGTDILIQYDPGVARATGVAVASVAAGQTLTVNLSQAGVIRISLFGPFPLAGGGVLLNLGFESTGSPGSRTTLDLVAADLNEGSLPTSLVDGEFCVDGLPPEVQNLSVGRVAGSTTSLLSWDALPFARAYNVYRGARPDLTDLACLLSGIATTSTLDDGVAPASGQLLTYAITGVACSGESSLGFSSDGVERQAALSCP